MKKEMEEATPQEVLAYVFEHYPRTTIALSGVESGVLVDMAAKMRPDVSVFTLDTGRMHEETYRFLEAVRARYHIAIDVMVPDVAEVEALVKEKGLYSFYAEGPEECCRIRRIEPLRRVLAGVDAWITGQRRGQSPARGRINVLEADVTFGDVDHPLMRVNPLASWDVARVWSYVRAHRVPINALYERGYQSTGCSPCTRVVLPGEQVYSGIGDGLLQL